MKQSLAILSLCAASLASAAPAPDGPQLFRWYFDEAGHAIEIYSQPGLCVRTAEKGAPEDSEALGERDGWRIYTAKRNTMNGDCLPFYSSTADWKKSGVIYAQDPGVLVRFKRGVTEGEIQQLFHQHGVKGEQQSLPQAYFLKDIQGENALRLSEQLFKSEKVEFAQPNWREQVATR